MSNSTLDRKIDAEIETETESIIQDHIDNVKKHKEVIMSKTYKDTTLVFALVGAVGTKNKAIAEIITDRLGRYNYTVKNISISRDVIPKIFGIKKFNSEYERITTSMDLGNKARRDSMDNSILALGAITEIASFREIDTPSKRECYIINSLKHPEEVELLREVYTDGFYLFGIDSDEENRLENLKENMGISEADARKLIERDVSEEEGYGQHTRDTFQMSDFFVSLDRDFNQTEKSVRRILDLIFGHPHITPTFEEHAMFMAFTSALRSADLSRQVGAVISKNNEIIASGANDTPKAGGGLYWPVFDITQNKIIDVYGGRDYKLGYDSNKQQQKLIIDEIAKLLELSEVDKEKLKKSSIKDITEYGRVVHAEMEALLMCARNNVSTRDAELYGTTFPCHNCAKHIVAAGIKKVVYIEPYPKSKALQFHPDSITLEQVEGDERKVVFQPFIGIGPRRFFELFSMSGHSGNIKRRKDKEGNAIEWKPEEANAKMQLLPVSYLDKEIMATYIYKEKMEAIK